MQEKYTSKYLDLDLGPQFAFGHGSGYATFTHGAPRLSRAEVSRGDLAAGDRVTIAIDVTNTSARAGDEVVQVYVHDLVASVAPPVRRLIAFERRTLAPGETATFEFAIGRDQLGFWTTDAARRGSSSSPASSASTSGSSLERTQPVELRVV